MCRSWCRRGRTVHTEVVENKKAISGLRLLQLETWFIFQ